MDLSSLLSNLPPVQALAAVLAGIAILVRPRTLNYAVAAYLLLVGGVGLLHAGQGHTLQLQPLLALVAGILILVRPAILNYVVAAYLILVGLLEGGILNL